MVVRVDPGVRWDLALFGQLDHLHPRLMRGAGGGMRAPRGYRSCYVRNLGPWLITLGSVLQACDAPLLDRAETTKLSVTDEAEDRGGYWLK